MKTRRLSSRRGRPGVLRPVVGVATIRDMALPRFRHDALDGPTIRLSGREARHALGSRRLGPGDEIVLFDGTGREVRGRIVRAGRGVLEVQALERRIVARPSATLTLAVAMPQGSRADWLVEKAAELGVVALIPLVTRRSQVVPSAPRVARWRRKAVEAAKQCGAAFEMGIGPPVTLDRLSARRGEFTAMFVADPDATAECIGAALSRSPLGRALAVVGPEGGLTAEEIERLTASGAVRVRLAVTILRVETAAIALAAAWAGRRASGGGAARAPPRAD